RLLLDAKAPCFHPSKGRAGSRFCRIMWLRGPDYMLPAAPAVVVDNLGLPIAVGVEEAADMGKRVPLGRVLRVQKNGVVAQHVRERCLLPLAEEVVVGLSL